MKKREEMDVIEMEEEADSSRFIKDYVKALLFSLSKQRNATKKNWAAANQFFPHDISRP